MDSLKKLPIWVNWKLDPERGKIPKNPRTGGNAQSNNPLTWASYELAIKQANDGSGRYDGVGFMFADGICGIDIDKVDDPQRARQALEIIAHFGAYTEQSPSGTGYHIIFKCDLSKIPQLNGKLAPEYYQKNPHNGIECYFSGLTSRFFTYTGKAVSGFGMDLDMDMEDRTGEVLAFLDKYMRKHDPYGSMQKKKNPPKQSQMEEVSPLQPPEIRIGGDSHNILSIARKARNGKKFSALFDFGDISAYSGDDSSADLALANMLAFYCQGDAAMVESLFNESELGMRDKWKSRADYRSMTIGKAIALCGGEFYKAKSKPKNKPNTPDGQKKRGRPAKPNPLEGLPLVKQINPFSDPARYTWDSLGLRLLFADTYKDMARYVPEAREWYIYNGKKWAVDMGGMVVQQYGVNLVEHLIDCRKFLMDERERQSWLRFIAGQMKKKERNTIIADAKSVYPVYINEFDNNPYLFNCQNCTLDLEKFTRHGHRPDDFLTKISNVNFDPDIKCLRWEEFINEVMQGDEGTEKFLQKSLGYSLSGDTSEECFFILYGNTTRNGKGTTMETILHLMGDYGHTSQPETIAQKQAVNSGAPSEDIAALKGARFVNISEPDKGLRLNNALIKQMTGGDKLRARFLHQNSFEFRPEYKLFINTNHLPRVGDDSVFKSGRVMTIPFERHFPPHEQDKGLKAFFRKPGSISGIFNWCLEGLKMLNIEGLERPQAVIDATDRYREESDVMGQFISECLVAVVGIKTRAKEVYQVYEAWAKEYGYGVLNLRNLIAELRRKGLKLEVSTGKVLFLFGYGIACDEAMPLESTPPQFAPPESSLLKSSPSIIPEGMHG